MIIKTDADIIKGYFEDYSGLLGGYADRVILPEDEKEVRDILLEASSKKVPVTISGGGTGVTGARIPFGGWVIATERFNKIIAINHIFSLFCDACQSAVPFQKMDQININAIITDVRGVNFCTAIKLLIINESIELY